MHWDNLSYLLYHSGNNCLLFTYVKSECCAGPWNLGLRAFEIRRKHIKINHFLCGWGNFIRTRHIKQKPVNNVFTSFTGHFHLGTTIAQGAATAWRRSDDGSVKRDPEEGRTPIGSARPARFTGGDGPPL